MSTWLWVGLGLVLAALGVEAWLIRRRRKQITLAGQQRSVLEGPDGKAIELRRQVK